MDKVVTSVMTNCERTKCNVRVNSRYVLPSGAHRAFCTEDHFVEQVAREKHNWAKGLSSRQVTHSKSDIELVEDLLKKR